MMRNLYKLFPKTSRLIRRIIVFAAIMMCGSLSNAEWTQTGPDGGDIKSLCVSGTNLFAGTWGGGVFLSTDNGLNWTAVNNGLMNIYVTALIANGTTILAGTWGGGVFRSTDNGANWAEVNNGMPPTAVSSFAVNGTSFFVGASGDHSGGMIYRSTDDGINWTLANNGIQYPNDINSLIVKDTTIFAATWFTRVYRSTNNGDSWIQASNGLVNSELTALGVSGPNIFVANYIIGGVGGAFLSTDDGNNWNQINNGLPAGGHIRDFAVSGTNVYAATREGIFLTTNNGSNWTSIGLTDISNEVIVLKDTDLFVGGSSGVFYSNDNGTNWTSINKGLTALSVHDFISIESNLFTGTGGGVYSSADSGITWTGMNNGLTNMTVSSLAKNGTYFFAGTSGSNGGVFRSTDDGANWSFSGLPGKGVQTLFVQDSILFAGVSLFGGGAYRSTNNGTSWQALGLASDWVFDFTYDKNYLFAATFTSGVFRSTNYGLSWEQVNSGLASLAITSLAVVDGSLFAGTGNAFGGQGAAGIFRSTDNGENWTQVNTGLPPNLVVWSLIADGSNLFAGSSSGDRGWGNVTDNVFVSSDQGENWTSVSAGLINDYVQALFVYGSNLYAGGLGSSTWWRPLSEMIMVPPTQITLISPEDGQMVSADTVVCVWASGIPAATNYWFERATDSLFTTNVIVDSTLTDTSAVTRDLATNTTYWWHVKARNAAGWGPFSNARKFIVIITGVAEGREVQREFRLMQNYPNPFNPTTQIRYALPKETFVSLQVYNVLGQKVATLVNEIKQPGDYSVKWGATGYASGIYFYRLSAGEYTNTRKLIIAK